MENFDFRRGNRASLAAGRQIPSVAPEADNIIVYISDENMNIQTLARARRCLIILTCDTECNHETILMLQKAVSHEMADIVSSGSYLAEMTKCNKCGSIYCHVQHDQCPAGCHIRIDLSRQVTSKNSKFIPFYKRKIVCCMGLLVLIVPILILLLLITISQLSSLNNNNNFHYNSNDCKWEPWGQWKSCSKPCGTQERTRTIFSNAKYDGKKCVGSNRDTRACRIRECPGKINYTNNLCTRISSYCVFLL